MNILKGIRKVLGGRKAYIVGILLIIAGLIEKNYELILEGLGIIALRAGIAKKLST